MARVHGAEMKRRSSHELSGLASYPVHLSKIACRSWFHFCVTNPTTVIEIARIPMIKTIVLLVILMRLIGIIEAYIYWIVCDNTELLTEKRRIV